MSYDRRLALQKLERYFGFSEFRPLQEAIVKDALAGRDVVAVLPTGAGKSLCYQLPAILRDGLTVVVSPLIALMKDQVDTLQAMGIRATYLNSSLTEEQFHSRLDELRDGYHKLLYVAPERLATEGFYAWIDGYKIDCLVVDEAHCISTWGHSFRPEYRNIIQARISLPGSSCMAFSASATRSIREDISRTLALQDPATYVASFNRRNLRYRIEEKWGGGETSKRQVADYVARRFRNQSGIVYTRSKASAEEVADRLRGLGVRAAHYHADVDADQKTAVYEAWMKNQIQVVCATIAFGMGINKPDVRFVVHHDMPKDLESYYQETGRAGRDGLPSECVLFYGPWDARFAYKCLSELPPGEELDRAIVSLEAMERFVDSDGCRRAVMLRYFGETLSEPCSGCGVCG